MEGLRCLEYRNQQMGDREMITGIVIAILCIYVGLLCWFLTSPTLPECYGSRFCVGDCKRCSIAHLTKGKE